MTRDEAISLIKQYIDYNNPDIPDFYTMEEACKVVIKALENQPTDAVDRVTIKEYLDSYNDVPETNVGKICEDTNVTATDCIRRESVTAYVKGMNYRGLGKKKCLEYILKYVENLPPVTPQPCEDCVSRQMALEAFGLSEKSRKYGGDHSGYDTLMKYEIQDILEDLPSVTPQPCEEREQGKCPFYAS